MSPSLPGAAWQTRNGVDPVTGAPNGFSVLRGDIVNEGVEAFFNEEMKPGSLNARVPVVRVDFAGYGASAFSKWLNPNALASVSQVRFDVFVGRTAYEVVQVASILYPWAAPLVRTITFERRKNALVFRADSGWVATGPGIYRYPDNDEDILSRRPPPEWTPIETHPGLVGGAFNVRRIRETGRVVERLIGTREDRVARGPLRRRHEDRGGRHRPDPRNGPRSEHRSGRLRAALAEGLSARAAAPRGNHG